MIVFGTGLIIGALLVGYGLMLLNRGRIYVGYGEGYLYGRSWVVRGEDPLLFWIIVGGLFFLGGTIFIFALTDWLGALPGTLELVPDIPEGWI